MPGSSEAWLKPPPGRYHGAMSLNGYLQLGTAISGTAVVTPPSGTNYTAQPINYDVVVGGVLLSSINCVFGPVSGSWGTLVAFGITDVSGNALLPPGTLQQPFTPVNGQLVVVPPGNLSLIVGSQFAVGPGTTVPGFVNGPTTSGTVALTSGAYSQIVGSGTRNMLQIANLSQVYAVKLIVGNASQPASGAAASAVMPPYGTWPPVGINVVPTHTVWGIVAQASGAASVSFLTG